MIIFWIKKFLRKIIKYTGLLFKELKFESNVRILYENKTINANYTQANICLVTHQNISDVWEYEGNKYLKKYKTFLKQGDLGYYAYLDGKWVHRTWVMIGPRVVNRWSFPPFKLKEGEAYCHFGETEPSARGHNIAAAVLTAVAVDLKGKADHIYSLIDENNFSSRRTSEKAGFVEVKRLKRTHFIGLNFYRQI